MTILMIFQAETYLIVFCQRSKDFIHKNLGMLVHYLEESFQYLNTIEINKCQDWQFIVHLKYVS